MDRSIPQPVACGYFIFHGCCPCLRWGSHAGLAFRARHHAHGVSDGRASAAISDSDMHGALLSVVERDFRSVGTKLLVAVDRIGGDVFGTSCVLE